MTYRNTIRLKNRKNYFAIGDFIKSVDEMCFNTDSSASSKPVQKKAKIYEFQLDDCDYEYDIKEIEKNIVAILTSVREQEPNEVKTYLKNISIAKNISFIFAFLGIVIMFALVLHTNSIGNWIFCFVSWLVGCVSFGSTLVLILKEWRKEGYGKKTQRKRRIRNQAYKFNFKKR